jgi:hypothetical protein
VFNHVPHHDDRNEAEQDVIQRADIVEIFHSASPSHGRARWRLRTRRKPVLIVMTRNAPHLLRGWKCTGADLLFRLSCALPKAMITRPESFHKLLILPAISMAGKASFQSGISTIGSS